MYRKPQQPRAIATEQRFLDSLDVLLKKKSLAQLSIDEIAEHAHQTRGAFLKRFGSKKQSLFILWSRYCKRASNEMAQITALLPTFESAKMACIHMSKQLETIQRLDFSANRAMHEDFQENLRIDPQTQKIFLECVELMRCTQRQFFPGTAASDTGAFAAAQLLVTINYNHVLKAMPGLPADPVVRHEMVGEIMALVLSR